MILNDPGDGIVGSGFINRRNDMGLFTGANRGTIQAMYHRANKEADGGFVDPKRYDYLRRELQLYAKQNNCSMNDAIRDAKTFK